MTMSKDMFIEGNHTTEHTTTIVKALSNDIRLNILSLLSDRDMNIQTLAANLNLSKPTVLSHVNILEKAGFIKSKYLSGSVGNQRVCKKIYDKLIFNFTPGKTNDNDDTYYEQSIPVGNYFDFEAYAPCGLARSNNIIKKWDDPNVMCDSEHVQALLAWTAFGYFEYKIPLDPLFIDKKVKSVEIDLELSAHNIIKNHDALMLPPHMVKERITDGISDVTFWVDGFEVATHTIYAGSLRENAIYTPLWWQGGGFLHGELINVLIDENGCFINNKKVNDKTFEEIINDKKMINFRVGIKEDSMHQGGIALFGKNFGKSDSDILIKTYID